MRRRVIGMSSLLAVLVGAGLLVAGCAANPTDALSKLAHLDKGAHPSAAVLPPVVPQVDAAIVPSSLRLLAEADGTKYWVGVTHDDDVCFIADAQSTRASCVDAERFGRFGATLQLEQPARRVWLHTEYMTVGPGWTVLSPSIALRS